MGESIVNAELLQVIYMCSLIENAIVLSEPEEVGFTDFGPCSDPHEEQMSQGG